MVENVHHKYLLNPDGFLEKAKLTKEIIATGLAQRMVFIELVDCEIFPLPRVMLWIRYVIQVHEHFRQISLRWPGEYFEALDGT